MRFLHASCLASILAPLSFAGEIAIETRPFSIEHTLSATVIPESPQTLEIATDGWPSFEVRSIAPHGRHVAQGDVLVEFDNEALDRALEDRKKAYDAAVLTFTQTEAELKSLKDNQPLKLDAAKRAARNAADDLAYFNDTSRKAMVDRAAEALKRSTNALENQREELRQLEKMYTADDLTEETEEIILVRQRDAVASAEFALQMATMEHKRTLDTTLPRMAEDLEGAARTAQLALTKTESDLTRQIELKEIEVAGAKTALDRQKGDLAKTVEARKLAEPYKAPAAGWFYHGPIQDGRWTTDKAAGLIPHASVAARQRFATFIPEGAPLTLVAFTDEAAARSLVAGTSGTITFAGLEALEATANLKAVSHSPGLDGKYRVDLNVSWPSEGKLPAVGSTAQVRLLSYEKPAAIVVPAAALKPGKDGWTVTIKLADGKTAPRPVKRGRASGDQIEILSGLEAGQVVLTP